MNQQKKVGRIIRNEHKSSSNYVGQKFGEFLQSVHFSHPQLLFVFFWRAASSSSSALVLSTFFGPNFGRAAPQRRWSHWLPLPAQKSAPWWCFKRWRFWMTQQPDPNLTDGLWNDKLRKKSVETLWNCVKAISWSNMNEDSIYLLYVFRCFRCINHMYV